MAIAKPRSSPQCRWLSYVDIDIQGATWLGYMNLRGILLELDMALGSTHGGIIDFESS